jgi:hypothetical protein
MKTVFRNIVTTAILSLIAGGAHAQSSNFCTLATSACTQSLNPSKCNTSDERVLSTSQSQLADQVSSYLANHSEDMVAKASKVGATLQYAGVGVGFENGSQGSSDSVRTDLRAYARAAASEFFSKYQKASNVVTCDKSLAAFTGCMSKLIDKCAGSGWENDTPRNPPIGTFSWGVTWRPPAGVESRLVLAGPVRTTGALRNCQLPPGFAKGTRIPQSQSFSITCERSSEQPGSAIVDVKGGSGTSIHFLQYRNPCGAGAHLGDSDTCACDDGVSIWSTRSHRCLQCPSTTHLNGSDGCDCDDANAVWDQAGSRCSVPVSNKQKCANEDYMACHEYSKEILKACPDCMMKAQCYRDRGLWIPSKSTTCELNGQDSQQCSSEKSRGAGLTIEACERALGTGAKPF